MRRRRAVGSVKSRRSFVVFAGAERFVAGWFGASPADDLDNNCKLEVHKKTRRKAGSESFVLRSLF